MYIDEIKNFFHDCSISDIKISDSADEKNSNGTKIRKIVFNVSVNMSYAPMVKFFEDRWDENFIRRPTSELEFDQLKKRVEIYSRVMWCGRREEWEICIGKQIRVI